MGAAAVERVLRPVGAVAARRAPGFQAFPVDRRLRAGMYVLARTLGPLTSTAVTTREEQGAVILPRGAGPPRRESPHCLPRNTDRRRPDLQRSREPASFGRAAVGSPGGRNAPARRRRWLPRRHRGGGG